MHPAWLRRSSNGFSNAPNRSAPPPTPDARSRNTGATTCAKCSERPYRIIYRILPDRIDVISVMHYRQLLPEDLAKLP
jgi:plasmid stabilization system protein ParE